MQDHSKAETVMTVKEPKQQRRGRELYKVNPFLQGALVNTKQGVKKISDKSGTRMMVVNGTSGEVMAPAGFWQAQEVDKTQFVKLYVNGVRAFKGLSNAGTRVFELLYLEVQKQIGKDRVYLSFHAIEQDTNPMSEATYMRGMRELVEKEFIAPSMLQGWFFINPDFMWNGDRLAFVKEYRLKGPKPKAKNLDLFDETSDEGSSSAGEAV